MPPLPNRDQLDMKQCMIAHAWGEIWCLKNCLKLGCSKNFTYIFGSNFGNHAIFCKDLTNIVSCVLSYNERLAIFHFEFNPNFSYFQIFDFWLGWIGTALLAMQNQLLGSDFHQCIFPKCPMNKNNKLNHHNYNYNSQNGIFTFLHSIKM